MIRPARDTDVPEMLAIYAPYVTDTTYTFEFTVPSAEEFAGRLTNLTAQFPWLVWEENGHVLGYAYGSAPWERAAYRWCAEISIYLAPSIQRKGIGRQLYEAVESILLRQGYRVVYALITAENSGSIAFHKAMGYAERAVFTDCGYKFGRWLNVTWMDKRLCECGNPTDFPEVWTKA